MKTDSILNVPLDGGMSMERTITADGDVEITITAMDGREIYSEEILRVSEGYDEDEDDAVFDPAAAEV